MRGGGILACILAWKENKKLYGGGMEEGKNIKVIYEGGAPMYQIVINELKNTGFTI